MRKKDLKAAVKAELENLLGEKEEPAEWRMKVIDRAIKFLAVEAKLDENEYGGFYKEGDDDGKHGDTDFGTETSERKKPRTRRNEGGDADASFFSGGEGKLPS